LEKPACIDIEFIRVREALDVVQSKETGPAPAPLGRRFFAWILDGLIVFIVASVATLTAGVEPSDPEYGWVILASFLGYRLLTPLIWRGTPAKRLLGLIVASGDGGLASAGQLLGRELTFLFLALIPVVNLINALVVLFASNHRGWHDHAANTIVVRKRSRGGNP
jgi:uncharacterized RDD family membrane protein YckC